MKLLFWDIELAESVEKHGGWAAALRGECGISVIAIYDSETGRYYLYDEKNLDEAVEHLNTADILIGFNTVKFDTVVTQAVTGRYLTVQQFDLLQAIYDALGHRTKGWKLDEVCQRTLGMGKTDSGDFATVLSQDKQYGKLFTYCMHDVALCVDLWNHLVDGNPLKDPADNDLFLTLPTEEFA